MNWEYFKTREAAKVYIQEMTEKGFNYCHIVTIAAPNGGHWYRAECFRN
jgi:hypothetical protein